MSLRRFDRHIDLLRLMDAFHPGTEFFRMMAPRSAQVLPPPTPWMPDNGR
jgi:hypothetical protein